MSDDPPAPSLRPLAAGALPVPTPSSAREPLRPMPARTIALISGGIFVLTAGVVLALWWAGTSGLSGQALVTARFDALRTGLSIGIGGGGIFALYLAWRRQHATEVGLVQKERDQADVARAYELQREVAEHTRLHAERVATATEKDAADRRVTELYTKASEQLGSDKAPVRLAGLYALERLAQHNEDQRSTVISLLCAYLRMPYDIPLTTGELDQLDPASDASRLTHERHRARVEEREVRLTAQRILTSHLPAANGSNTVSWGDHSLDLSEAVLFDLDLSGRRVQDIVFYSTVFVGVTRFDGTIFAGDAKFLRARLRGLATFKEAVFHSNAVFYKARFDSARLAYATFEAIANFEHAAFGNDPSLSEAIYKKQNQPRLNGVTITKHGRDGVFYMPTTSPFPAGWVAVDERLEDDGRQLVLTLGRPPKPTEKETKSTIESHTPRAGEDSSAP